MMWSGYTHIIVILCSFFGRNHFYNIFFEMKLFIRSIMCTLKFLFYPLDSMNFFRRIHKIIFFTTQMKHLRILIHVLKNRNFFSICNKWDTCLIRDDFYQASISFRNCYSPKTFSNHPFNFLMHELFWNGWKAYITL